MSGHADDDRVDDGYDDDLSDDEYMHGWCGTWEWTHCCEGNSVCMDLLRGRGHWQIMEAARCRSIRFVVDSDAGYRLEYYMV